MQNRNLAILALSAVICFGLAFLEPPVSLHAAPTRQRQSIPAGQPTVGSTFKNIQVLTDLKNAPVSQLYTTMQFMAGSLSVSCNYCHVSQHGPYDSDAKKTKRIAREMIKMTRAINANSFEGRQVVTCNTCHQGSLHPQPTPTPWYKTPEEIAEYRKSITDALADKSGTASQPSATDPTIALPSVDEIMARYRRAVETSRLKSLRLTGTNVVAVAGGPEPAPFEADFVFPDKIFIGQGTPGVGTQVVLNGNLGRRLTPQGATALPPAQVAALRGSAEVLLPVKYVTSTASRSVAGIKEIGDKRYYVIEWHSGTTLGQLFFDVQSGLLYKYRREVPTALGTMVEEHTFEDYRTVNGVALAYLVTNHYMEEQSVFKVSTAEVNVAIDPARFDLGGGK